MNEKTTYRLKILISAAGVLIFAAIMLWLVTGLGQTKTAAAEQQLADVKQSVINGAVLCYSIEGVYPESLGYLKENYGLRYDENKYLIHYRFVSADIMPFISVFVNDGTEEAMQ